MKQSLAYLDRHGSVQEWYAAFGGEAQMTLCNPQLSLGAISSLEDDLCPTLGLFRNCYHEDAMNWMKSQIDVLNVSASAQNKLNAQQIAILAADIFTQYYYWNLADVCVFFGKVRRGQFGVFYNSVDNMSIMNWAREFDRERRHELEKYEAAVAEQRKREQRKGEPTSSVEEYLASLTDEQRKSSRLNALESGRLFRSEAAGKHEMKTGMGKPADLGCPPPLSAETKARRDAMIAQLMKENPEAFKDKD